MSRMVTQGQSSGTEKDLQQTLKVPFLYGEDVAQWVRALSEQEGESDFRSQHPHKDAEWG